MRLRCQRKAAKWFWYEKLVDLERTRTARPYGFEEKADCKCWQRSPHPPRAVPLPLRGRLSVCSHKLVGGHSVHPRFLQKLVWFWSGRTQFAPTGLRRQPIVCTDFALLIHRAERGPPSPLEKAWGGATSRPRAEYLHSWNPRVKRSDAFGITSKDLARRTNS